MRIVYDRAGRTTVATAFAEPNFPGSLAASLHGTGVARCRPEDHYDPRIGEEIAAGRAMADLGTQLADRAASLSITEEQASRVVANLLGL